MTMIDKLTPQEIARTYVKPELKPVEIQSPHELPSSFEIAFIDDDIYKLLSSKGMLNMMRYFLKHVINNPADDLIKEPKENVQMKPVLVNVATDLQLDVEQVARKHYCGNISMAIGALIRTGYNRYTTLNKKIIEDFIKQAETPKPVVVKVAPSRAKSVPMARYAIDIDHEDFLPSKKSIVASIPMRNVEKKKAVSVPKVTKAPNAPKVTPKPKVIIEGRKSRQSSAARYEPNDHYTMDFLKTVREALGVTSAEASIAIGRYKDYIRRAEGGIEGSGKSPRSASREVRMQMACLYARMAEERGVNIVWPNDIDPRQVS